MIGRRSFLRILGVAPVAAPAAVKAATSEIVASQSLTGISALPGMAAASVETWGEGGSSGWDLEKKALSALVKGSWPAHVDERIRRDAREVRCLDPDLVANRSMSLSTKVRIQRGRNYVRMKAECIDGARARLAKKALPDWLQQLW